MKYFVTGATGFVGGRVVRQLVDAGHQVAVVARNPAKAADAASLGIEIHQGDVTEKEILAMEKGTPGQSYIIAGPPHTFVDAIKLAQRITGVPAPRIIVPPAMMKAMAGMMSVIEKIVPVPEMYTAEYLRENAGVTYLGSNAKAVRELGYHPRSLEDGLPETLRHEMQLLGTK